MSETLSRLQKRGYGTRYEVFSALGDSEQCKPGCKTFESWYAPDILARLEEVYANLQRQSTNGPSKDVAAETVES